MQILALLLSLCKERAPTMACHPVQVIRIASLGGGVAAQLVSVGSATAALPTEGTRCAGPVAVIGVREGALWLVDARGLPFVLPMSHPGMRARSIAAHGDAAAACALAEHGEGACATPFAAVVNWLMQYTCLSP